VLPLLLLFSGCGLAPDRDVWAFNTCRTRHPQDAPLCEAPRQAYQVDLPTVAARPAPGFSGQANEEVSGWAKLKGSVVMSDLVVVAFPTEETAEEVRQNLLELQQE
jgi:hypothetical protein